MRSATTACVLALALLVSSVPARAEEPLSPGPGWRDADSPFSSDRTLSGTDRTFSGTHDAPSAADRPFAPTGRLDDAPKGDGRRTMGRFAGNLGRGFVGVFQADSLKPLALGAALAGASALLDTRTEGYFQGGRRAPQLGSLGRTLGSVAVMAPVVGALFVAARGTHDTRFRAATYDMAQATLITQGYTTALKYAVGRMRPDGSDSLSFPSGHTSNAFALATVAQHYYGTRAGLVGYGAATLIGVSRMETGAHHLSDVVAGAAIGWVVGHTVVRLNDRPARSSAPSASGSPGPALAPTGRGRQLALVPAADASGNGLGLGVSLSF